MERGRTREASAILAVKNLGTEISETIALTIIRDRGEPRDF